MFRRSRSNYITPEERVKYYKGRLGARFRFGWVIRTHTVDYLGTKGDPVEYFPLSNERNPFYGSILPSDVYASMLLEVTIIDELAHSFPILLMAYFVADDRPNIHNLTRLGGWNETAFKQIVKGQQFEDQTDVTSKNFVLGYICMPDSWRHKARHEKKDYFEIDQRAILLNREFGFLFENAPGAFYVDWSKMDTEDH
jgi:hypothetical protein